MRIEIENSKAGTANKLLVLLNLSIQRKLGKHRGKRQAGVSILVSLAPCLLFPNGLYLEDERDASPYLRVRVPDWCLC